jgi:hypothetical protein
VNPTCPQEGSAPQPVTLLEAVTHYAIGGTDALEALGNQSAALLLDQITDHTCIE